MESEREELGRLVRELPDEQVPRALAVLRRLARPASERPWPPEWFGIAPGDGAEVGVRRDELPFEGFAQ